jgi:AcrR family transcriptional regulator
MAKKIIYKIHEIKKELILQEASLIFEKSGYDSMKISDLAKNVGVSQSTIYSMFENKEGLYIEYIKLQIKIFLEELTQLTINSTAYEKLNKFTALKFKNYIQKEKAIESNIKNNPLFFNTFYHDITNPLEEVYKFLTDTFLEYDPNISHDKAVKLAYLFNSYSDGYITLWMENDIDLANISNEVCTSFLSILKSVE